MERDPAASAIEAFRQATTCAPSLRQDNWAAVQARISGDGGVQPRRRRSSMRTWTLAAVALAAAAAAIWWGAQGFSGARVVADRDVAEQAIDASQRAASGGRAQPVPATPPEPSREAAMTSTPLPVIAPRETSARHPVAAPIAPVEPASTDAPIAAATDAATDDPLGREARLIAAGRTALGRGALDDAAAAIERHAREFPDGTMGPERMALAVRLQCARRDLPAARAAAAVYLRAHPESPLARRLGTTPCGDDEIP